MVVRAKRLACIMNVGKPSLSQRSRNSGQEEACFLVAAHFVLLEWVLGLHLTLENTPPCLSSVWVSRETHVWDLLTPLSSKRRKQ